jgi:hypothetical protein
MQPMVKQYPNTRQRRWSPSGIAQLQAQANAWLASFRDRPNHGDWMNGRSPNQLLNHESNNHHDTTAPVTTTPGQ